MAEATVSSLVEKRVVVSGGAGFLGGHVVAELRRGGCREVLVPRSSEFDLRRPEAVARMYDRMSPQIVIHLAAVVGGIGANRENPGRFFYDNLTMGVELMEQARSARHREIRRAWHSLRLPEVYSSAISGRRSLEWISRRDQCSLWPGQEDAAGQAQAYREQYGFNAIYLLPVNLYGPHDSFDPSKSHVIPALIKKCIDAVASRANRIEVWGTGAASREFLYVEDCARAVVLATERYDKPQPVNLGAGREIKIRELVTLIARLTGFKGDIAWDSSSPTVSRAMPGRNRASANSALPHRRIRNRPQTHDSNGIGADRRPANNQTRARALALFARTRRNRHVVAGILDHRLPNIRMRRKETR